MKKGSFAGESGSYLYRLTVPLDRRGFKRRKDTVNRRLITIILTK